MGYLVASLSIDGNDKAHAACFVLVRRIVEALSWRSFPVQLLFAWVMVLLRLRLRLLIVAIIVGIAYCGIIRRCHPSCPLSSTIAHSLTAVVLCAYLLIFSSHRYTAALLRTITSHLQLLRFRTVNNKYSTVSAANCSLQLSFDCSFI